MKSRNYKTIDSDKVINRFSWDKYKSRNRIQNFYPQKTFSKTMDHKNKNIKIINTKSNIFSTQYKNKFNFNIPSSEKSIPTSNIDTYYKTNTFSPSSTRFFFTQSKPLKEKNFRRKIKNTKKSLLSIKNIEFMKNNNNINNNINNHLYLYLSKKEKNNNVNNNNINKEKINYIFVGGQNASKNLFKQKMNDFTLDLINNIQKNYQSQKDIKINSLSCPDIELNEEKKYDDKSGHKSKQISRNYHIYNLFLDPSISEKLEVINNLKEISSQTFKTLDNIKRRHKLFSELKHQKESKGINIQTLKNIKLNKNKIDKILKNKGYDLNSNLGIYDPLTLNKNKGLYKDYFERKQKEKIYLKKQMKNDNIGQLLKNLNRYDKESREQNVKEENSKNINSSITVRNKNDSLDLIKSLIEENKNHTKTINIEKNNNKNNSNEFYISNDNNNNILNYLKDNSLNKLKSLIYIKNRKKLNKTIQKPSEYIKDISKKIIENIDYFRKKNYMIQKDKEEILNEENDYSEEIKNDEENKNNINLSDNNIKGKKLFKIPIFFNNKNNNVHKNMKKNIFKNKTIFKSEDKNKNNSNQKKDNLELIYNRNYINIIQGKIAKTFDENLNKEEYVPFNKNNDLINLKNKINEGENEEKEISGEMSKEINSIQSFSDSESSESESKSSDSNKELYDIEDFHNNENEIKSNLDNKDKLNILEDINQVKEKKKGKNIENIENKEQENKDIKNIKEKKEIKNKRNSGFKLKIEPELLKKASRRRSIVMQKINYNTIFEKIRNKKNKKKSEKNIKKKYDKLCGFNPKNIGDENLLSEIIKKINMDENLKVKLLQSNKYIFTIIKKGIKTKEDYKNLYLSKKKIKYMIKTIIENIQSQNITSKSQEKKFLPKNLDDKKKLYKYLRSIEFKIKQQLEKDPEYLNQSKSSSASEKENIDEDNFYSFFPKKVKFEDKFKKYKKGIYQNYNDEEDDSKSNIAIKKEIYDILNENFEDMKKEEKEEEFMRSNSKKKKKFTMKKKKYKGKSSDKYKLKRLIDEKYEDFKEKDKEDEREKKLEKRINNFSEKVKKLKRGEIDISDYEEELSQLMMEQIDKVKYEGDRLKEIRILSFFKHFQIYRMNEQYEKDFIRKKMIFKYPVNFTSYPRMTKAKSIYSMSD